VFTSEIAQMTRREWGGGLGTTVAFVAIGAEPEVSGSGPRLWLAQRGRGGVYLFPFAEPKDRSWLTSNVSIAFETSAELWVELGAPPSAERVKELNDTLGLEPAGQTSREALDPTTRARAEQYIKKLKISRQTLRP
jgi:hypothetical protein